MLSIWWFTRAIWPIYQQPPSLQRAHVCKLKQHLSKGADHIACGKITESIQRKSPCFLLLISRSAREGKQSLTSGEKGGVEGDLLILFDPLNLTSVPAQSF